MSHLTNYTFLESLGAGSFGKVKRNIYLVAIHNSTEIQVAVKTLKQNSKSIGRSRMVKELVIHKILKHRNIIRM